MNLEDYKQEVSEYRNETLLNEFLHYTVGDDYDGCRTKIGELKYPILKEELIKRLKECDFITDKSFEIEWY